MNDRPARKMATFSLTENEQKELKDLCKYEGIKQTDFIRALINQCKELQNYAYTCGMGQIDFLKALLEQCKINPTLLEIITRVNEERLFEEFKEWKAKRTTHNAQLDELHLRMLFYSSKKKPISDKEAPTKPKEETKPAEEITDEELDQLLEDLYKEREQK